MIGCVRVAIPTLPETPVYQMLSVFGRFHVVEEAEDATIWLYQQHKPHTNNTLPIVYVPSVYLG